MDNHEKESFDLSCFVNAFVDNVDKKMNNVECRMNKGFEKNTGLQKCVHGENVK